MRKIFFDIETRNTFADAKKVKNLDEVRPEDLDISIISIYDSQTKSTSSYTQETLKDLWEILENADCLIGYNSEHFDLPLLNKYHPGYKTKTEANDMVNGLYYKKDLTVEGADGKKHKTRIWTSRIKHVDLLADIQRSIGRRLKLNDVCFATIGRGKNEFLLDKVDEFEEYRENRDPEKIVQIFESLLKVITQKSDIHNSCSAKLSEFSVDPKNNLEKLKEVIDIISDMMEGNNEAIDYGADWQNFTTDTDKNLNSLWNIIEKISRSKSISGNKTLKSGKKDILEIKWWNEYEADPIKNKNKLDNIQKYCEEDVILTKDLYDYAVKNKKLLYEDFGRMKEIPLTEAVKNWKENEFTEEDKPSVSMSLF